MADNEAYTKFLEKIGATPTKQVIGPKKRVGPIKVEAAPQIVNERAEEAKQQANNQEDIANNNIHNVNMKSEHVIVEQLKIEQAEQQREAEVQMQLAREQERQQQQNEWQQKLQEMLQQEQQKLALRLQQQQEQIKLEQMQQELLIEQAAQQLKQQGEAIELLQQVDHSLEIQLHQPTEVISLDPVEIVQNATFKQEHTVPENEQHIKVEQHEQVQCQHQEMEQEVSNIQAEQQQQIEQEHHQEVLKDEQIQCEQTKQVEHELISVEQEQVLSQVQHGIQQENEIVALPQVEQDKLQEQSEQQEQQEQQEQSEQVPQVQQRTLLQQPIEQQTHQSNTVQAAPITNQKIKPTIKITKKISKGNPLSNMFTDFVSKISKNVATNTTKPQQQIVYNPNKVHFMKKVMLKSRTILKRASRL